MPHLERKVGNRLVRGDALKIFVILLPHLVRPLEADSHALSVAHLEGVVVGVETFALRRFLAVEIGNPSRSQLCEEGPLGFIGDQRFNDAAADVEQHVSTVGHLMPSAAKLDHRTWLVYPKPHGTGTVRIS
ncbi:hypothetical protein ACVWZV_000829 [Bradyrhizobium sp. GM5.1]|uniref:hypothetical protein n=1 Tax=Bradyrhizobium sp. 143 TaxID=2782619 RepID=UPI001FF7BFBD|nr:hypothetical protein [Bradyrhizobium sp. 143]